MAKTADWVGSSHIDVLTHVYRLHLPKEVGGLMEGSVPSLDDCPSGAGPSGTGPSGAGPSGAGPSGEDAVMES